MISLNVPGSKSSTNRALILAALARGTSVLKNVLLSDDTKVMILALKSLGVACVVRGTTIRVTGSALRQSGSPILCGNAGTAMRFLTAILATQPFTTVIDGDARMRQRPLGDLIEALEQLGSNVVPVRNAGFPPVKITGPLRGGKCTIAGNTSSQYISALLMAAPLAVEDVTITIRGKLVSRPYVDMTIELMKTFGVVVERKGYTQFHIRAPQVYTSCAITIEGDASSASYFWGLGWLSKTPIDIRNIPIQSLQADAQFPQHLEFLEKGGTLDCSDFPDSAMTLAVLCALGTKRYTLTGLANLRIKESDRLAALTTELKKIGCTARHTDDAIIIQGRPKSLHGASIETYKDHRMAMCFGMLSCAIPGLVVENKKCVSKTYPNFWRDLLSVKKQLRHRNIVLSGMRGSGKTTLGKKLALKLGRRFIDVDAEIARMSGMSVAMLVKEHAWKRMRQVERQVIQKIATKKRIVVATGGGSVIDPLNASRLKKNGFVIYLDCPTTTLANRLKTAKDRPSLLGKESFLDELKEVYTMRQRTYEETADCTLPTAHKSTAALVDEMQQLLSRRGIT